MLVSHRFRFVYLKTRKTAGTSVEIALQPLCEPPLAPTPTEECDEAVTTSGIVGARMGGAFTTFYNHMPAHEIRRSIGDDLWARNTTIACVRNPYDKMVSWYFWDLRVRNVSAGDLPFVTWLKGHETCDDLQFLAPDGIFDLDVYVRYEDLEADLTRCARRIGADPADLRLGRFKAGVRPASSADYRSLYDRRSRSLVAALYEPVLRHFGYRF